MIGAANGSTDFDIASARPSLQVEWANERQKKGS